MYVQKFLLLLKIVVLFVLINALVLGGICFGISKLTGGWIPGPIAFLKEVVASNERKKAHTIELKRKFDALEKRTLQTNPDPEDLLTYAYTLDNERMRNRLGLSLSKEEASVRYQQYIKKARELNSPTLLVNDALDHFRTFAGDNPATFHHADFEKYLNQLIRVIKNQCFVRAVGYYDTNLPTKKTGIYISWYHYSPREIENHPDLHNKIDAVYLRLKHECNDSSITLTTFANKELSPQSQAWLLPPWQTELRQKVVYAALARLMNMKALEAKINNDVSKTNQGSFEKQKLALLGYYQALFPNRPNDIAKKEHQ